MTKARKTESKTRKKPTQTADQELSDINQNGNQTTYANRDILEKKQCLPETYTVIQLRRIYTNSLV